MRMRIFLWIFTTHLITIILASSEAAPDPSWNPWNSWKDSWNDLSHRIKRASVDTWIQSLDKYFEDQSGFTGGSSETVSDSSWNPRNSWNSWKNSWNDLSRRIKRASIDSWLQPLDKYFEDQSGFKRESSEAVPDSSWNLWNSWSSWKDSWNDLSRRIKRASNDIWLQPLDKFFEDHGRGARAVRESAETATVSPWNLWNSWNSWNSLDSWKDSWNDLSHRIKRASIDTWLQPLNKYFEKQSGFTGFSVERESSGTVPDSSWNPWNSWSSWNSWKDSWNDFSRRIRRATIDTWLQPLDKYFEDQTGFTGVRVERESSEAATDFSWNPWNSWSSWNSLKDSWNVLSHRIKRASNDFSFQMLDEYFEDQSGFLSESGSRVERDSNEDTFSTLQSRISTLSRVVTGVTLYNGLVDESIPVDEVIGELMNTGPISFEKLENFDRKVDSYVKKLEKASNEMDDKSKNLAKALSEMAIMKEMWNDVGDLNTLPDSTQYETLKIMGIVDLSAVEKFDVNGVIKTIKGKSDFTAIISLLKLIGVKTKRAMEVISGIEALKTLESMTPFFKYVELSKYYQSSEVSPLKRKKPGDREALKSDFDRLLKLKNGDRATLSMLDALAMSQSMNSRINRKFTSGFVNGFKDLKNLPEDSKNPWILNQFGWLELEDGLKEVSKLDKQMTALNDKWKPLKADEVLKAVKKAASVESKLEKITEVTKTYTSVLDQFTKKEAFDFPAPDKSLVDDRTKISRAATQMLKKGNAIRRIVDIFEKQGDSIDKLNAANQASIDDFVMFIEALHPYVLVIQSGQPLKKLSADIKENPPAYTELNTDDAVEKKFYGSLKTTSKDFDNVAALADLALQFSELKSDKTFGKHIESASKIASESFASIQSIRTAMGNIETFSTDKTQMLSQLEGLQTFSKPLGDSVAVIDKMDRILKKKNELITFVTNGYVIDTITEPLTDVAIKEKVKRTWIGFEEVSQECMDLFGEVKRRKDGVGKPNDDKLESYGPFIEGLAGLKDVDLHGNDKMIAINTLLSIPNTAQKPQLNDLKNSLMELLPLDMTFARHSSSLPGMTGVLTGITGVFTSVGPKPTVKPVPVTAQTASPRSGNQVGGEQTSTVETTTEKGNGVTVREWIIGGVCVIVGIFIGGGAHYWYNHQQEKKQKRLARKRKAESKRIIRKATRKTETPATTVTPSSGTTGTKAKAASSTRAKSTRAKSTRAKSTRAKSNKAPIFLIPSDTPHLFWSQKAMKDMKKKGAKKEASKVVIDSTQASEVSEVRPRRKKLKTEYYDEQEDDNTLDCVKSIEK